ncbi:MAG: ABC transporter ATP-binding protein [Xanthomonadales bacterium]|nr:ABC transporter ATP-binding protein [Xanthomonadales bacterium]
MTSTPALSVRNLTKTYDNGVVALRGLSLDVAAGDFFALLGPNGAGKSTLIGMIASLVNLGEGEIEVFGLSVRHQRNQAMSQIGLVPQEINFNQFEKPVEILVNQAGFYGVPRKIALQRAEKYLRALSLWDKRDATSRTLSGGMKRRLMIARAMMNEPRLLILDEPTAGVDIEIRRSMWQFVREINRTGTTVILTTHYLEEAEQLCRNIAIIDHGRIIEHSPMRSLLAKLDVESFVLDIDDGEHSLPAIDGVRLQRLDNGSLEAEVPKAIALSEVFAALHHHGIRVKSMRNKANRLEELFMRLVGNPAPPPATDAGRSP